MATDQGFYSRENKEWLRKGGVKQVSIPVRGRADKGRRMEQKATIDAIFALALGLYTYVNPVPTVTGAPNLVKLL